MPSVMWWNVKRLAARTPEERAEALRAVVAKRRATINILGEVNQSATDWRPINATFRRKNGNQLCYAVLNGQLMPIGTPNMVPPSPSIVTTARYRGLRQALGIKGGSRPGRLMDRKPIRTDVGNVAVYAIHARSGRKAAAKAVAAVLDWILSQADRNPPLIDRWLLIGDMNCTPQEAQAVAVYNRPADVRFVGTGGNTHAANARVEKKRSFEEAFSATSELDWVITNVADLTVSAGRNDGVSDHDPIIARWGDD